jgi:hypothetical protein
MLIHYILASLCLVIGYNLVNIQFTQNDQINNPNNSNHLRTTIIYDNKTTFYINKMAPESETMILLSPECMFEGNYSYHDCKTYLKIFLDIECELSQEKNISNFRLYLSPFFFNKYDARININYNITNKLNYSWLNLAPGLICQNNNVCMFVMSFTFSYKDWNDVPISGNSVLLDCSRFKVYSFV